MSESLEIAFAPLIPGLLLAALTALAFAVTGFAAWRRARGVGWRFAIAAVLVLLLANPSLVREQRESLSDVVIVVADDSPSQAVGERQGRTEAAIQRLDEQAAALGNIDLRVVRAGRPSGESAPGTRLLGALRQAVADVPAQRIAGAVMVTDGQVHDIPEGAAAAEGLTHIGPVHGLLTGRRNERDRRIVIERAARFGMVGTPAELSFRIEDDAAPRGTARVTIRGLADQPRVTSAPLNTRVDVTLPLDHAGDNLFEIEVEPGTEELSLDNNRAVVTVSAVRDRLKVLLISGHPHPGERTWRNLLKSDPAVELIHFTILRPPEKQDATPLYQLSLIPFPIRELFEEKLESFDLIIFDRYQRSGFIPLSYFANVSDYVRRGGALMIAAGPDYATPESLSATPLNDVLPALPSGVVFAQPFKPQVSPAGRRHPVTAALGEAAGATATDAAPNAPSPRPAWGQWYRQIGVQPREGMSLLSGIEDRPLLLLNRVGRGRVALMLSDHFWLWARGHDGGGPHAELMRRIAHWLMKEPELEEEALRGQTKGGLLSITRKSLDEQVPPVRVIAPSGAMETLDLKPVAPGRSAADVAVKESGLYRLEDGKLAALVPVGPLDPLESADLRTTEAKLRPLVQATRGGFVWMGDGLLPDLRRVRAGQDTSGLSGPERRPWIGVRESRAYRVAGLDRLPLLPVVVVLVIALGVLVAAWRQEGR